MVSLASQTAFSSLLGREEKGLVYSPVKPVLHHTQFIVGDEDQLTYDQTQFYFFRGLLIYIGSGYSSGSRTTIFFAIRPAFPV